MDCKLCSCNSNGYIYRSVDSFLSRRSDWETTDLPGGAIFCNMAVRRHAKGGMLVCGDLVPDFFTIFAGTLVSYGIFCALSRGTVAIKNYIGYFILRICNVDDSLDLGGKDAEQRPV